MNALETVAVAVSGAIRRGLVLLFHNRITARAVGDFTWADLAAAAVLGLLFIAMHGAAAVILRRKKHSARTTPRAHPCRLAGFEAIERPLYVLIWVFAFYLAAAPLLRKLTSGQITNAA